MDAVDDRLRQLRWRCRRGMKEIDVLLLRFLEHEADALAAGGHPQFERLLTHEDDELWRWLLGRETAHDAELAALVRAIRAVPADGHHG